VRIEPRHYARQAFLIMVLNPKAIVFYMAFFPLFTDPATHWRLLTFGVMALTIAGLTWVIASRFARSPDCQQSEGSRAGILVA
jgi:threonine/homoserine/homoserine lactone efflux protein